MVAFIIGMILVMSCNNSKDKKDKEMINNYLIYNTFLKTPTDSVTTCGFLASNKPGSPLYSAGKVTASTVAQTVSFEYSNAAKNYGAVIFVSSLAIGQKVRLTNSNASYLFATSCYNCTKETRIFSNHSSVTNCPLNASANSLSSNVPNSVLVAQQIYDITFSTAQTNLAIYVVRDCGGPGTCTTSEADGLTGLTVQIQ